jgi:hypothetical protein
MINTYKMTEIKVGTTAFFHIKRLNKFINKSHLALLPKATSQPDPSSMTLNVQLQMLVINVAHIHYTIAGEKQYS